MWLILPLFFPFPACANRIYAAGGLNDLILLFPFAGGLYYLCISGLRVFKIMRIGETAWHDALLRTGAIYFLTAAGVLVVMPLLRYLEVIGMNPVYIFCMTALPAPWVMLLCVPRYAPLRRQSLIGLLTMPLVVFVLAFAIVLICFLIMILHRSVS